MKVISKILTPILSFLAGIVAAAILFYPLLFVRFIVEAPLKLIFSSSKGNNFGINMTAIIISYVVVFFIIGMFFSTFFRKRFPNISSYFTIPFVFPEVCATLFMFFFDRGVPSEFQLFILYMAAFIPIFAYIAGLIFTQRSNCQ